MDDWTSRLAEAFATTQEFPDAIRRHTAVTFADTIAAMAAGFTEPEVRRLAGRPGPPGPAWCIGQPHTMAASHAAFVNATAGTAAEMDEGHYGAFGHPGIHCIPAALAVAEETGASGRQMVQAIIVGYEAGARLGAAARLRSTVHSHGTWGVVGAAVSVARLRGYTPALMREAMLVAAGLSNASSRSSGWHGASVRSAFAGIAARNGIIACDLAEAGFTGEDDAVSIAFGEILGDRFDASSLLDGLGETWAIQHNFFKLSASCRETHGALDAYEDLVASNPPWDGDAQAIASINLATFAIAANLDEQEPKSTLAARYSIPFTIATRIVRGACGPADYQSQALEDARIRSLARKVVVTADEALTKAFPEARLAELSITTRSGNVYRGRSVACPGDKGRPLSEAEHLEKFLACSRSVWGEKASVMYDACMSIDVRDKLPRWERSGRFDV